MTPGVRMELTPGATLGFASVAAILGYGMFNYTLAPLPGPPQSRHQ